MARRRSSRPFLTGARAVVGVFALLLLVSGGAFTAANVLPQTNVDDETISQLPELPSPPGECSGITTTSTVSGTGVITGSIGNDWLIGSEAIDTMDGLAGNDCIEGKGGADVIHGGLGNDVCIGGPGTDTFVGCETQIQ